MSIIQKILYHRQMKIIIDDESPDIMYLEDWVLNQLNAEAHFCTGKRKTFKYGDYFYGMKIKHSDDDYTLPAHG